MGVATASELEAMIECVVRALLSGQQDGRLFVRDLVQSRPAAAPLDIVYVLVMAAGTVEALLASPAITGAAQDCWRMAGLVGVDLWMMERLGLPRDTTADLMAYWSTHDRYFLD
ncbi:hypothetical protein LHP98_06295 [Rhodobacter sp. Har01]|uniref:hypothetical protein n=1 Tax=Rhodobacter sp. Har01 TaxID=2883999 RepID=UPI001D084DFC|nr:hypothetical protein [Rhodobacter sp. Har01]MCB6177739.1 hypothetical protein [Rhodobacter sp. Har01]